MRKIVLGLDYLLITVIFMAAMRQVNNSALIFAADNKPEPGASPVVYAFTYGPPKPAADEPLYLSEPVVTLVLPPVEEQPTLYFKPLHLISNEEIDAVAVTIAGECYDDKPADKRRVAEVIVNRVSDGRFGDSIIKVIKAPGQFYGYWSQNRPVSENDVQIAEETLYDWYAGNCKALSEYLYFCAGSNRENKFRTQF